MGIRGLAVGRLETRSSMPTPTRDELRAKWSDPAVRQQEASKPKPTDTVSSDTEDKLSRVKICSACQAQGIIKVQSGYRVLDVVCEKCEGEGCIITPPPGGTDSRADKNAGTANAIKHNSTAEKIGRIEQLIEQAEDLDVLEKLEAALRSGNLSMVD